MIRFASVLFGVLASVAPCLAALAANRLANPHFVSSLEGWSQVSVTGLTTGWELPGVARASWSGATAPPNNLAFALYQDVSVVAGQSYAFGGLVDLSGPPSADGAGMVVCFYTKDGAPAGSVCPGSGPSSTDGFEPTSRTVASPAGAARARVFVVIGKVSGLSARFDDLFFDGPAPADETTITPDPASPLSSDPIRFTVSGSSSTICTPRFSNGTTAEIEKSGSTITLMAIANPQCGFCPIGIIPSEYTTTTSTTVQLPAGVYTVRFRVSTCGTPGPVLATRSLSVQQGSAPSVVFTALPSSITAGDRTELSWSVQNARSVSIDNGIGPVPAIGSRMIAPSSSTTYRLTAVGTAGTREREAAVSVTARPEVLRASLRASRTAVRPGEPVTLTWTTTSASSVVLEEQSLGAGGIRTHGLGTLEPSGSLVVFPTQGPSTTYVLRATKGESSVFEEEPIIVRQVPAPVIGVFTASPPSGSGFSDVLLSWFSTGATEALLEPDLGPVSPSGSTVVRPAETTLYSLKVSGDGGDAFATREVTVAAEKAPEVERGGGQPGQPGANDGPGTSARFDGPSAVRIDGAGNLYVVDAGNHTIRKIDASGNTITWAGQAGKPGKTNGFRTAAQFDFSGFAGGFFVDRDGSIYVEDGSGVRIVTPEGEVSDCPSSCGGLSFGGAVTDAAGNRYESDAGEQVIRKIPRGGSPLVLAGAPGQSGFRDGAGADARFHEPGGIAVDRLGYVFVSDVRNNAIRRISPAGVVETIAGEVPIVNGLDSLVFPGSAPSSLTFDGLGGALVMGANGVLYIADTGSNTIKSVSPDGEVRTVAGAGTPGSGDGPASVARFNRPLGIAVDSRGRLLVADSGNDALRVIDVGAGPGNGLPMLGGRFSVAVRYRNQFDGNREGMLVGRSLSSSSTAETALFTFGDPLVVELVVRLSDARPFRNNIDVFFGGVSDVAFTITVTDALSGLSKSYAKPPNQPLGGVDRQTFKADPSSLLGRELHLKRPAVQPLLESTLRLLSGRYEVRVRYRNQFASPPSTGYLVGQSIASSSTTETVIFTFSDPEVGEWMVRFSDARPFANRIDLFHGGVSDIEFTIEVKDTVTGKTVEYPKPPGSFLGAVDRGSWVP